MKSPVFVFADG